jgi:hypothetical protein
MICIQVLVTGFLSLQWMVMYMYFTFTINDTKSDEQSSIIFFVYSLSNNLYYLNNTKSFYLSILTSGLFQKTFFKALVNLIPHYIRQRIHM